MTRKWQPLRRDQAHLWDIDLRALAAQQSLLRAHLSCEENERALRFRHEEDATRFICVHGAMREILSLYTQIAPAKLQFTRNEFGKPFLFDESAHDARFNFSYRHHRALLAVTKAHEIGVDIEWIDTDLDFAPLLETICSANESRALATLNQREKQRAFFSLWTRKEAVLKQLGCGFSLDARRLEIGVAENCGVVETDFNGENRSVCWRDLDVGGNYAATIALPDDVALICHEFPG